MYSVFRENELGWPNGLAIDYKTDRLWWVDALLDTIQSSRFDGSDVSTLRGPRIVHPYGLAVYDNFVYYTDWRLESIARVNISRPLQ